MNVSSKSVHFLSFISTLIDPNTAYLFFLKWLSYTWTCIYSFFFFLNKFIYLFIYPWLCWVFASVRGPSLVAASGGHSSSRCGGLSSSRCGGLSLSRPLPLRSTGSRRAGSAVVAHAPSCPAACGIFPDQGSNPCLLHWQADSQPLRRQGSPVYLFFFKFFSHLGCYIIPSRV